MLESIKGFGLTLTNSALIGLLFSVPLVAIGFLLNRRRRRFRAEALEPFTDMPLRPPGESLRIKAEEKNTQFDEAFTLAALAGICSVAAVTVAPANQKLVMLGMMGVFSGIIYFWCGRKMFILQKQLWNYRLGFMGERVTGEKLNQLAADGFQVFHDLEFEGFNIDHVIVGPQGVYAVETKTRSKPADIKGQAKAKVFFDGTILKFPRFEETQPIEQARLNAKTLSKWLSQSTGEYTPVNAIVAIPGWWVERTGRGDVNVLNPKEIAGSFPARSMSPLPADKIQRIVHQLTERCRLAKNV